MRRVFCVLFLGPFLISCQTAPPVPPPRTTLGQPAVEQQNSVIALTIRANTGDVAAAIRKEYASKPLSSGRSGEIGAKLNSKLAIFQTAIWINHDIRLQDFQMAVEQNHVSVFAVLSIAVSIDLKHGMIRQGITINDVLKCNALVAVDLEGNVHLMPDATVSVVLDKFADQWRKSCVPGSLLVFDVGKYLQPKLKASSGLFAAIVNRLVVAQINKKLSQTAGGPLDLTAKLRDVALALQTPRSLGQDAYLLVHPRRLLSSDLSGTGSGADNQVQIVVGIEARPEIVIGDPPPQPTPADVPFVLTDPGSRFSIDARGSVSLAFLQDRLRTALDDYLAQKYGDKGLTVSDLQLYQSGPNLALALTLKRKSGFFADLGTFYLFATPTLSADGGEIALTDVRFQADSKSLLVKTAAWLLDAKIDAYLQSKAKFSIAGPLEAVATKLAAFSYPVQSGSLDGHVSSVRPVQIWVADDALWAQATASGDVVFTLTQPAQ